MPACGSKSLATILRQRVIPAGALPQDQVTESSRLTRNNVEHLPKKTRTALGKEAAKARFSSSS
jgi:hypothetical protein